MNSLFDSLDFAVGRFVTFYKVMLWIICILLHVAAGIVAVTMTANGVNILIFEKGVLKTFNGIWFFSFVVVFLCTYLVRSMRAQFGTFWGKIIAGTAAATPVVAWLPLALFVTEKEVPVLGASSTPESLLLLTTTVMLVGLFVPLKSRPGT